MMPCRNCNHPIIFNPVMGRWGHGQSIALAEEFCYVGGCECEHAEVPRPSDFWGPVPRVENRWW